MRTGAPANVACTCSSLSCTCLSIILHVCCEGVEAASSELPHVHVHVIVEKQNTKKKEITAKHISLYHQQHQWPGSVCQVFAVFPMSLCTFTVVTTTTVCHRHNHQNHQLCSSLVLLLVHHQRNSKWIRNSCNTEGQPQLCFTNFIRRESSPFAFGQSWSQPICSNVTHGGGVHGKDVWHVLHVCHRQVATKQTQQRPLLNDKGTYYWKQRSLRSSRRVDRDTQGQWAHWALGTGHCVPTGINNPLFHLGTLEATYDSLYSLYDDESTDMHTSWRRICELGQIVGFQHDQDFGRCALVKPTGWFEGRRSQE